MWLYYKKTCCGAGGTQGRSGCAQTQSDFLVHVHPHILWPDRDTSLLCSSCWRGHVQSWYSRFQLWLRSPVHPHYTKSSLVFMLSHWFLLQKDTAFHRIKSILEVIHASKCTSHLHSFCTPNTGTGARSWTPKWRLNYCEVTCNHFIYWFSAIESFWRDRLVIPLLTPRHHILLFIYSWSCSYKGCHIHVHEHSGCIVTRKPCFWQYTYMYKALVCVPNDQL